MYQQEPYWADNSAWLSTLVYFASDGGGSEYAWDPAHVISDSPYECQYYFLPRSAEHHPVQAGRSCAEFVEGVVMQVNNIRAQALGTDIFHERLFHRVKSAPVRNNIALWLAFNNNTARDLAISIRDKGRTDAFPILADALEEAGCTNADLLDSCRAGDPDVDGVWVLRVLLGEA
jgi:hypothetical protein